MADYPLIETGKTKAVIDTSLGELNDVAVENPSHNQVLTYISGSPPHARWQPTDVRRDNWLQANKGNDFSAEPNSTGTDSIAVGRSAHAHGYKSIAMGDDAGSFGTDSAAFGYKAVAQGNYSIAIGSNSEANGHDSIAIGSGFDKTSAYSDSSIAIGKGVTANDVDSKIILLTNDAGIRVKPNGDVQTSADGGDSWSTISASEAFPSPPDAGDQFDRDVDIGAVVYFNGEIWKKGQANNSFTIGSAVLDWIGAGSEYTIKNAGIVNDIKPEVNGGQTLIPGYYYYLSKTHPGQITKDEPDQIGDFVVPVYMAMTQTSALIVPFRANLIGETVPAAQVANHKMLFQKFQVTEKSESPSYFKVVYANGTWVVHTDKELFRSIDTGKTWEEFLLAVVPQTEHTYDIDTNGRGKWIAVQKHFKNHILVSNDDAVSWESTSLPSVLLNMKKIVCDRETTITPTWIMYGNESDGYLVSRDNGLNWEHKTDHNFENIVSNGNGTWVAWEDYKVYFSEDNAATFKEVLVTSIGALMNFSGAKLSSNRKGRVICAVQGNQVYKSNDWGKTWTSQSEYGLNVTGFDGNVYLLVNDGEGTWYASGNSAAGTNGVGCAVSIDDGATWYAGPAGLNISNVADSSATSGAFGEDRFIVGRSPSQCSRTLLP